jgi:branched-chain amino acid transport system permease protein
MNMIEQYIIHLSILIGIYLILAISLQVSMGFTGIPNFGHMAFFGIGAYTSALLVLDEFPFWFAFLSAGILAMIFGYVLSLLVKKLKGDYLALATISFSFVIGAILLNWISLTKGPSGIPGIPKPSLFGINFSSTFAFLILTLVICAACYFLIKRITDSPFGKVLESVRDDELASKTLGKNTSKAKNIALMISAFFTGLAGSLYAHYISYIDPSFFTMMAVMPILCIIIIGGLASLKGTVIATIIIVVLPEPLRFIGFSSSIIGPMRQIIYAILLLVILLYAPKGIYGKVEMG